MPDALAPVVQTVRVDLAAAYRLAARAGYDDLIWNHFVVNTVFYAGLIGGPFAARHLLRRMRGLCLICGYNLRGDLSQGCPECGWGRSEKRGF